MEQYVKQKLFKNYMFKEKFFMISSFNIYR